MSVRDRPRRDVERNHEAILSAAIAVLADSPQATMLDIAHASGTGRSTLYRHFPDREALIAAIYDRVRAEAALIVGSWLPEKGEDDPIEVIAGLCNALAAIGDRYRFLQQYGPMVESHTPERSRAGVEALTGFITAHQGAGRIRSDLPIEWLLAMLGAIIKAAAKRDSDPTRTSVVDATVRSLLAPVSPP